MRSEHDEFMLMVNPHLRIMRAWAVKSVGEHRAEDAVQTALMGAWKVYAAGVRVEYPRAWLMRVLRNTCINIIKHSSSRFCYQFVDERKSAENAEGIGSSLDKGTRAVLDPRSDPCDVLIAREERDAVLRAVSELPESQRDALLTTVATEHGERTVSGAERMLVYRARSTVKRKVKHQYA